MATTRSHQGKGRRSCPDTFRNFATSERDPHDKIEVEAMAEEREKVAEGSCAGGFVEVEVERKETVSARTLFFLQLETF